MIRRLVTIALVGFVAAGSGCKPAPAKKMGSALAPPSFRQVGIDPSVVGLAGAVGEIVSGAGSTTAWVKFDVNATDWQAFPGTSGGVADGSISTAKLADGSVTAAKVGTGAITGTKIDATTVTAALNTATASLAGTTPGLDPWYVSAVQAAQALGCTEWPATALVQQQGSSIGTATDPGVMGGAVKSTSGVATFTPNTLIIQNPKTNAWYVKLRFKQSVVASGGVFAAVGLGDGTSRILLWDLAGSAPVPGNWYVQIYNGSSTQVDTGVAVNTNWNDMEISHASSGANIIFKINGTQVASVVDTNLTTSPLTGEAFGNSTMVTSVRKFFPAWIGSAL
jgi:hypothetical protein